MRKVIIFLLLFVVLPLRVHALDYTAPTVPPSGETYMPESTESFGEGLWEILKDGAALLQPAITEAAGICLGVIGAALLLSLLKNIGGSSAKVTTLVGSLVVAGLLFSNSQSLIGLAKDTVREVSDYGRLLIPIMTGSLAASGGAGTAVSLYTGTVIFDSILSSCVSGLLVPMVNLYLALAVANSATGESVLIRLRDLVKWLMTWMLKIILYVFTGYMGITKVVSGSADASALKATKLTISGMVPVVGGILSDASESILVGAGIMKNGAGVYGILAIAAVSLEPFLRIGVQYLMLKMTAAICAVFAPKETAGLIQNFSTAMGLLLAMTGSVCLMLLISVVCFMKGVS